MKLKFVSLGICSRADMYYKGFPSGIICVPLYDHPTVGDIKHYLQTRILLDVRACHDLAEWGIRPAHLTQAIEAFLGPDDSRYFDPRILTLKERGIVATQDLLLVLQLKLVTETYKELAPCTL